MGLSARSWIPGVIQLAHGCSPCCAGLLFQRPGLQALVCAVLLLTAVAAHAGETCLVVGITDGDTLKARCGVAGSYEQRIFRLAAIDAPEKGQAFGQRSRQSLAGLCFAGLPP